MYLVSSLVRRQSQMPPPDSQDGSQTANDSRMPSYVWGVVVFFVLVGLVACFYAQRNHRRRYLMHQAALDQGHSQGSNSRRPDRAWIMDTAAAVAGIRRPPRAARTNLGRRGSQNSVTSLPVYMENPGAHEVVLMQRTAPKEVEAAEERDRANDSRPSSMAHSSPAVTLPVISITAPLSTGQYQPPSSPPPTIATTPATTVPSHPPPPITLSSPSSPPVRQEESTRTPPLESTPNTLHQSSSATAP